MARKPSSAKDFENFLKSVWSKTSAEICQKLINSYKNGLEVLIINTLFDIDYEDEG